MPEQQQQEKDVKQKDVKVEVKKGSDGVENKSSGEEVSVTEQASTAEVAENLAQKVDALKKEIEILKQDDRRPEADAEIATPRGPEEPPAAPSHETAEQPSM